MKLRNKKTGEILETGDNFLHMAGRYLYNSLAELNEEWEDYEEPKGMWAVGEFGELYEVSGLALNRIEELKEIGNYFETKEEAEKAVEKLKAWKRLKNNGLGITEWSHGLYLDKTIVGRFLYKFPIDNKDDIEKDLDLLFSGEDD